MGSSFCLSTVPILRCVSLSRIETIALVVPVGLEVIFSSSLIFTNRDSSRKHLLLTAEGSFNITLAVLDMLSHLIPAVREDLNTFRTVDLVLAGTSSLPLLFYTLFVYATSKRGFIPVLPTRFHRIAALFLLIFIPVTVGFNELASYIGITHRLIPNPTVLTMDVVGIGFNTDRDQSLWTFFTSFTLAALVVFQALSFSIAFLRLAKIFIRQRNIETSSVDEVYLFKGMGWTVGGLKLGMIETIIGFAPSSFGTAFTRRLFRMLSRACLAIGTAKGLDVHEDFLYLTKEVSESTKGKRKSFLKTLISNPARLSGYWPTNELGQVGSSSKPQTGQRVTVHQHYGAPFLHMRLSDLDMPSPQMIEESVKSRPESEWMMIQQRRDSLQPRPSFSPMQMRATIAEPPRTYTPPRDRSEPVPNAFASMHSRGISEFSARTTRTNDSFSSLFVKRELGGVNPPGLPSHPALPRGRSPNLQSPEGEARENPFYGREEASVSRSNSALTRSSSGMTRSSSQRSIRRKPVPAISDMDIEEVPRNLPLPTSARTGSSDDGHRSSSSTSPITSAKSPVTGTPFTGERSFIRRALPVLRERKESERTSWGQTDDGDDSSAVISVVKNDVASNKSASIRNAPKRATPIPVRQTTRGSVYVEPITIPPRRTDMPEVEGSSP